MSWPIAFGVGRFSFGIFHYWIGFSNRSPRPYRVIDVGFFKVMWIPKQCPPQPHTRQEKS